MKFLVLGPCQRSSRKGTLARIGSGAARPRRLHHKVRSYFFFFPAFFFLAGGLCPKSVVYVAPHVVSTGVPSASPRPISA